LERLLKFLLKASLPRKENAHTNQKGHATTKDYTPSRGASKAKQSKTKQSEAYQRQAKQGKAQAQAKQSRAKQRKARQNKAKEIPWAYSLRAPRR
jgi:hypothetical protein